MKYELQSAANFLVHLIRLGRKHTGDEAQLDKFRVAVVEVLRRRYRDHWFPEKPFKGSGYRCIRINGKMDPIIAQAAESCGLPTNTIHQTFPSELTMWIDPLEVSYRIGENGSICVLYEHKENTSNEPWKPTSTGSFTNHSTTSTTSTTAPSSKTTSNASVTSSPVKTSSGVDNLPRSTPTSPFHSHQNQNNQLLTNSHHNNSFNSNTTSAMNSKNAVNSTANWNACKDSLRKTDRLLDPRKSVSIEQIAFVSS